MLKQGQKDLFDLNLTYILATINQSTDYPLKFSFHCIMTDSLTCQNTANSASNMTQSSRYTTTLHIEA
ncbi:hypothetical protein Cal6303_3581 [Calothrix sp. PCC 6303]|nr:hypothetical protein Cal6303_3581 [Calothrix sp. PCC 6303]